MRKPRIPSDLIESIELGSVELPRGLRVRVARWVAKLSEPTSNRSFQRNRVHYLKALLANVERGAPFREPFQRLPNEGPLPQLSHHLREVSAPRMRMRGAVRAVQAVSKPAGRRQRGTGSRASRRAKPAPVGSRDTRQPMRLDELEGGRGESLVDGQAAVIARLRHELSSEHDAHRRELQRVRAQHAAEVEALQREHAAVVDLLRAELGQSPLMSRRRNRAPSIASQLSAGSSGGGSSAPYYTGGGNPSPPGSPARTGVAAPDPLNAVRSWLDHSAASAAAGAPLYAPPAAAAMPLEQPLRFGDLPIALRESGTTFDHIVNSSEDDFMQYLDNFQQESERLAAKLKQAVARAPEYDRK